MADVPKLEQGCASPLELFNSIAAQGERVRALKAGKALKVCGRTGVTTGTSLHPAASVG